MASANSLNPTGLGGARVISAVGAVGEKKPNNFKSKFKGKQKTWKGKKDDKAKAKGKPKAKKSFPKKATKYDVANPSAYVTGDVWKKMTPEEQQAARDKRREKGIAPRNISALDSEKKTEKKTKTKADLKQQEAVEKYMLAYQKVQEKMAEPTKAIPSTIRIATLRGLQPVQQRKKPVQWIGYEEAQEIAKIRKANPKKSFTEIVEELQGPGESIWKGYDGNDDETSEPGIKRETPSPEPPEEEQTPKRKCNISWAPEPQKTKAKWPSTGHYIGWDPPPEADDF
jgi:hypothetical protein